MDELKIHFIPPDEHYFDVCDCCKGFFLHKKGRDDKLCIWCEINREELSDDR